VVVSLSGKMRASTPGRPSPGLCRWHQRATRSKSRPEPHGAGVRVAVAGGSLLVSLLIGGCTTGPDLSQYEIAFDVSAGDGELFIAAGSSIDRYLRIPPGSYLTIEGLEFSDPHVGELVVSITQPGHPEQTIFHARQAAGFRAVALRNADSSIVRLRFSVSGGPSPEAHPAGVSVSGPAVQAPRPTLRPDRPRSAVADRRDPRPNIIIYLVDTLRADRLSCYGYRRPISPEIHAFAEGAVMFENALAQSSWTRTSVASLFTGLLPIQHGVNQREDAMSDEALTLAEMLQATGYRTVGLVTNGNVGRQFGFSQGFDEYILLGEHREGPRLHSLSDEVNEETLKWLEQHRQSQPLFLYIHTIDPHAPYAPPPEYRRRLAPDVVEPELSAQELQALFELRREFSPRFGPHVVDAKMGSILWMQALARRALGVTETLIRDLGSLYDGEVAFNDESFGTLLDQLRRLGLFENSIILFLSDHGEEFYEHGGWEHGTTLYDEQLRIPLVVRFPSDSGIAASRVSTVAQHVDVLPTILDYLDLGDHSLPGTSLIRGTPPDLKAVFSHLSLDARKASSLVEGSWKLVAWSDTAPSFELFDRSADPGERVNLFEVDAVRSGYLLSLLESHLQESTLPQISEKAVVDEELRQRLRALGYL
jgi:arylsulfatase A-like enzyme